MRILAFDVGTSSVKSAVLDVEKGTPAGPEAKVEFALDHPTPDAAEIPAQRLWSVVARAARAATRGIDGVAAVGLSVMTPALVLLDAADQPLLPIWTHLDRRSRPVARQAWAAIGDEFLNFSGNRPLPGGISAVSWRQILTDNPYLDRPTKHYLHLNGWLGLHLTGVRFFDPANASFTGLFGTLTDQRWSEHWCDYFQVHRDWLPPIVNGGTTIGTLRSAVAAELNVPAGIPVKLGTDDTDLAMLAAGVKPGEMLHVVGTTQVLAMLTHEPRPSPRRLTRRFGAGDHFVHVTHNPVGGAALDWLHQLCFRDQAPAEFFDRTVPEAAKMTTRIALDPPYLGGDRLEISAHRAAFRDLTLSTDRMELLAAVLEAMRRHHKQAIADLGHDAPFTRVVQTGGGAEAVQGLGLDFAGAPVERVEQGSLHGVALLFR